MTDPPPADTRAADLPVTGDCFGATAVDSTADASGLVRFHILVRGLVQGVWFRESTRHEATRLGVRGWVKNLPDGRVEAVFEGLPAPVEAMLAWAERGPVHARVDALTRDVEIPRGERGFRVL